MFSSAGSLDNKVHVNFSELAYEVIQNDIRAFMEKPSVSGFLNRVIQEYRESANASVSSAVYLKKKELITILGKNKKLGKMANSEQVLAEAVETLAAAYEKELQEQAAGYPKGEAVKFRLNKKNFDALYDQYCPEGKYYSSQGKYIKAILEECARKTPLERERIFFGSLISYIQSGIDGGLLLKVRTRGLVFEVKPYSIMVDKGGLFHYLVGISSSPTDAKAGQRVASFRIAFLEEVVSRPKNYRSGRVTLEETAWIKKELQQKGVQFLVDETEKIVVKLDEQGRRMFQSRLYLRPTPVSIENGDEYRFDCTPSQIEFYFFKFGAHAEIIHPQNLRKKFSEMYTDACALYGSATY